MVKLTVKLNADQAKKCPFPIGCPVWYNFPEKTDNDGNGGSKAPPLKLKRGVVESASFSMTDKDIIYEIVYKDGDVRIVEEVSEHRLAYGAGCPVTIECNEGGPALEGMVVLCEPSPSDPSKLVYTATVMEGSRMRFEDGIDASRVKYRKEEDVTEDESGVQRDAPVAGAKTEKLTTATESTDKKEATGINKPASGMQGVDRSQGAGLDDIHVKNTQQSAAVAQVESVPASITCDLAEKKRSECEPKTSSDNTDKRGREGVVATAKSSNIGARDREQSHKAKSTFTKVFLPAWLVGSSKSEDRIRDFLNQRKERGAPSILTKISNDTTCKLELQNRTSHFCVESHLNIFIRSEGGQNPRRDVLLAKEKVEDALVKFMLGDPAVGRLFYDIAISCPYFHRRHGTTVEQRCPFHFKDIKEDRLSFMDIVELPYVRDRDGQKCYHGNFIIKKGGMLSKLHRQTGCVIRLNGREFNAPMHYSEPHVWVGGSTRQGVDDAVGMLKTAISDHRRLCDCVWGKEDKHQYNRHHHHR